MKYDNTIIPLREKPATCQSCGGTFWPRTPHDPECEECRRWRCIGEHLTALKRLFQQRSVVPCGNTTFKSLNGKSSGVSSGDMRWRR